MTIIEIGQLGDFVRDVGLFYTMSEENVKAIARKGIHRTDDIEGTPSWNEVVQMHDMRVEAIALKEVRVPRPSVMVTMTVEEVRACYEANGVYLPERLLQGLGYEADAPDANAAFRAMTSEDNAVEANMAFRRRTEEVWPRSSAES